VVGRRLLVGPGYLTTAGIRLAAGRDFGAADSTRSEPLAVILGETLAARLGLGVKDIGTLVSIGGASSYVVVGIAADIAREETGEPIVPAFFVLNEVDDRQGLVPALVRATHDPNAIAASIDALARRLFPDAAQLNVETTQVALRRQVAAERAAGAVFSWLALVAIHVCVLGVFALTRSAARERMREWAIRLAVGASRGAVVRSAMGAVAVPLLAGVVSGWPAALAAVSLLRHGTAGTWRVEPAAMVLVGVGVVALGVGAGWFAARCAANTNPASLMHDT
jgi:ABC-type antimicrobial peptide transport system permease subunit